MMSQTTGSAVFILGMLTACPAASFRLTRLDRIVTFEHTQPRVLCYTDGRGQPVRPLAVVLLALAPLAAVAQLTVLEVASAANFAEGMPARGAIAALFVRGIDLPATVIAPGPQLPTELAGVTVIIGGAPAPLFAAVPFRGYQQINLQVPLEAQFNTLDVPLILQQGNRSVSVRLPLRSWSPGEFFTDQRYYALLQHADFSLVTREHPARPGETLIAYLTGLPLTSPPVPTGQPAPFDPPARVASFRRDDSAEEISLLIDSQSVVPSFVGLAPGLVGVNQINFTVPANIPAGDRRLVLVRSSCRASATASCASGGGAWVRSNSAGALMPVRP
jgi:uncharacterized protein (TIGR03437 family)